MTAQLLNKGDAKTTSVLLSQNEWERVKRNSEHVNKRFSQQQSLNEQLKERKRKSDLISQNWPNKIVDLRKKQLEARKVREELKEKERQQVDLQEEQFQAQRRRDIIENAKRLLYFQTERIRKLHGALLLSQVLKERELQVEVNKKKAHLFDDVETKYLEYIRKQCEEEIKDKKEQEEKKMKTKQLLAAELTDQITRKERNEKQTKEDVIKMRQELKEKDEQYIEELLLELLNKEEKRRKLLQEQQIQQIEQKRIQQVQEQKQTEEYKKAELYAEAKRRLQNIRKERDKQEFSQRQDHLQKLKEKLGQQFAQKLQEEEERYKRDVAEKEEKTKEAEERKQLSQKKALQDCLAHCKLQIENQRKQANAAQKEVVLERKKLQDDFQALQIEVQERQERQFEKQRSHKLTLAQQISEKREKNVKERSKEMTKELQLYSDLLMEEEYFQDYATKMIDDVKGKGYNVLPLLKAAEPGIGFGHGPVYKERANIRPSYQASDVSGAPLPHILPQIRSTSSTLQRLGLQP